MSRLLKTAWLSALIALGSGAAYAQGTWNLSTSACDPGSAPGTSACTVGTVNANVTAWSNTGSGGTYVRAILTDQGGSGVGASSVTPGSPQVVENTGNDNHAFDNYATGNAAWGGSNEMALLSFNKAVNLTSVGIGWYTNDADISILRWTGSAQPDLTTMKTTGSGGLVDMGWELVRSADVDALGGTMATNSSNYSSWWLVSTYFGATSGSLNTGNDYFKLLTFKTGSTVCTGTGITPGGECSTGLSEPASLALVGFALVGIAGTRRRFAKATSA